jgi:hypothetical protein
MKPRETLFDCKCKSCVTQKREKYYFFAIQLTRDRCSLPSYINYLETEAFQGNKLLFYKSRAFSRKQDCPFIIIIYAYKG